MMNNVGVWSAVVALAACGCGTTATIERLHRDGGDIEGHIVASDRENLYIENEGRHATIPRSEIVDIDHPGNVAGLIGTLLSLYGVANVAVGLPLCDSRGAGFCTGVFLPLTGGVALAIWGFSTYAASASAANFKRAPRGPGFSPPKEDDAADDAAAREQAAAAAGKAFGESAARSSGAAHPPDAPPPAAEQPRK
jgi:hypothetical protein